MYHLNHYLASTAVVILAFTSLSTPAGAVLSEIDYSYIGNPFTKISSDFPVSRVSIAFTAYYSLVPKNGRANFDNYNLNNLSHFYFSNGQQIFTSNDNFSSYTFINIGFDTDADGNVSGNWSVSASRAHANGTDGTLAFADSITSSLTEDSTSSWLSSSQTFGSAVVTNNPGTWNASIYAPVPEPVNWIFFSIGLGAILLAKARQIRTVGQVIPVC